MGRFYKTSKGNYLDFIYKQPTNLLLKAQQAADQSLAQQEQAYGDLYGRLQINALTPDDKRAKNILQGYEQRIEEKAVELRNDPLKYINNPSEYRKLSNEIYKDKTRGQWASIEANAAAKAAYKEKLQKMVDNYDPAKDTGISQQRMDQLLAIADARFAQLKGTFGEAGNTATNVYSGKMISDYVDVFGKVNTLLKDIPASTYEEANLELKEIPGGRPGEKYIIKDKTTGKEVTKERVEKLVDSVLNDSIITDFYGSRARAGIPGFKPEDIQNKQGTGYLDKLRDFALNKFVYKEETQDIDNEGADKYNDALGNNEIFVDDISRSINTQYYGSYDPNDVTTMGTYNASADLLSKNLQSLAYLKSPQSSEDLLKALGNPDDFDVKEFNEIIQKGIRTGNFKNIEGIFDLYGKTIPDTFNKIMLSHTPEKVAIIKHQKSKSLLGLNKLKSDYNDLKDLMGELGLNIKLPANYKDEKLLNALKDEKNKHLKNFYTSLEGGKFGDEMQAILQSSDTSDSDLFINRIDGLIESIEQNKEDAVKTSINPLRRTSFNYQEALKLSKAYLGSEAEYIDQSINIIRDEELGTGLPSFVKENTPGKIKNAIRDQIVQKTHNKNGSLNTDAFTTFWTDLAGDNFKMTIINGDGTPYFNTANPTEDKLTKQQIVKSIQSVKDPISGEQVLKLNPVAALNLKGEASDISVSQLKTKITKIKGVPTNVYYQIVKYTDQDGDQKQMQLLSPIPEKENYGQPNYMENKQDILSKNSINNMVSSSNKRVRNTASAFIKAKDNSNNYGEDLGTKTQMLQRYDGEETEIKLIQVYNPDSNSVEMYVVEEDYDKHRNGNVNISELEQKTLRYTKNTVFKTNEAKAAIIEKFQK